MKGAIKPNHMAVNKYTLTVIGMPPLTPTEISGLEEELQTVELPDRTRASGGNTGPQAGRLTATAKHGSKTLAKTTKSVKKAGTASLKLRVKRAGKVKVKVTFKPASGTTRTTTVTVRVR